MTEHAAPGRHRLVRMTPRSAHEPHRSATPLELLFDLVFVAAFAVAGSAAAHLIAEGHFSAAAGGFGIAVFSITWAWINYTWFASGFDTDDWAYRLFTMLQMVGVIVLALGLTPMFESIDHHEPVDIGGPVAGYVIMRVAMIAQWMRVARQEPAYRSVAYTQALYVSLAQVGWIALALWHPDSGAVFIASFLVLFGVECASPLVARHKGAEVPWHPHHIAERFGLLLIITVGEGVLGTVAAVAALVGHVGWSADAALIMIAGVALTFGVWWSYFAIPFGRILKLRPDGLWAFSLGHIPLYAAIAAIGVGLHVAAYVIEGEAHIGLVGAVVSTAVPVAVFAVVYAALYAVMVRAVDGFHALLLTGTMAILGLSILAALQGASLAWCLAIMMFAPFVIAVGYEVLGHRHVAEHLERLAVTRA